MAYSTNSKNYNARHILLYKLIHYHQLIPNQYQCVPAYPITRANHHFTNFNITHQEPNFPQDNTIELPQVTLNAYKCSFYPRTIRDWNNLPIIIIELRDLNKFTYLLNFCN